jgi:hypothetical protein
MELKFEEEALMEAERDMEVTLDAERARVLLCQARLRAAEADAWTELYE